MRKHAAQANGCPSSQSSLWFWSTLAILICLTGCDSTAPPQERTLPEEVTTPDIEMNMEAVLAAANLNAYTQLSETLNQAQSLDSVVTSFLHHPNPLSLEECQLAWQRTYNAYLRIGFFYQLPTLEKPSYKEENRTYKDLHNLLDRWPIEGGYIDYLPGYPLSGIVNDMTLKISKTSLLNQHGFSDISYASVGFHPIEFLLFGEDGKRSAKDFVPRENNVEVVSLGTDSHNSATADAEDSAHLDQANGTVHATEHHQASGPLAPQNHNRRREYLRILTALLVDHLQQLVDRWEPAQGYYAKQWQQARPEQSIYRLYQAMVYQLQNHILAAQLQPALSKTRFDHFRSIYSTNDIQNWRSIVKGVQLMWQAENSFNVELGRIAESFQEKIQMSFLSVNAAMDKLPNDTLLQPLEQRQALLQPLQVEIIELLTLLYAGAELLKIPLAPIPISTE